MLRQLFLLTFFFSTSNIFALPDDQNQPINIVSDSISFNEKSGTATYLGNVVMKQGSIQVKADKIIVFYTKQQDTFERVLAEGRPAKYQQKPAENKAMVFASAQRIEYDMKNKRINLKQNARLEQEGNTFQGEKITYDLNKKHINASSKQSGRVHMVIQPKTLK